MNMQLKDKIAIVVGAGQSAGETIGNGRATAIRFARAGAQVLLVDRDIASAEETARMIVQEKGSVRRCSAQILRLKMIVGLLPSPASSAMGVSMFCTIMSAR